MAVWRGRTGSVQGLPRRAEGSGLLNASWHNWICVLVCFVLPSSYPSSLSLPLFPSSPLSAVAVPDPSFLAFSACHSLSLSSFLPTHHSPHFHCWLCSLLDKNSRGQLPSQAWSQVEPGCQVLGWGACRAIMRGRTWGNGGGEGFKPLPWPAPSALPSCLSSSSWGRLWGGWSQDRASHCFCPQQASEGGSYQPGKTQTAITMTTSHQPQDRYLGTQTEDLGSEMGLGGRVSLVMWGRLCSDWLSGQ